MTMLVKTALILSPRVQAVPRGCPESGIEQAACLVSGSYRKAPPGPWQWIPRPSSLTFFMAQTQAWLLPSRAGCGYTHQLFHALVRQLEW